VISFQVADAIGRVTLVGEIDPDKLFVQFNDASLYKWVSRSTPFPSEWMEALNIKPNGLLYPTPKEEVSNLVSKGIDLFFQAIDEGDLGAIKELHKRFSIDFDARNRDGMTALQVACEKNYKALARWLVSEAKVSLDLGGIQDFRAIHSAVQR